MKLQIFQHGIEKMGTAKIGTDGSIKKAPAHDEHLEKAADAVQQNPTHRRSLSALVSILRPDGGIEAELLFPLMPIFIGMVLYIAGQLLS